MVHPTAQNVHTLFTLLPPVGSIFTALAASDFFTMLRPKLEATATPPAAKLERRRKVRRSTVPPTTLATTCDRRDVFAVPSLCFVSMRTLLYRSRCSLFVAADLAAPAEFKRSRDLEGRHAVVGLDVVGFAIAALRGCCRLAGACFRSAKAD